MWRVCGNISPIHSVLISHFSFHDFNLSPFLLYVAQYGLPLGWNRLDYKFRTYFDAPIDVGHNLKFMTAIDLP